MGQISEQDQMAMAHLTQQLQQAHAEVLQANQAMAAWLPDTDEGPIVWDVKYRQEQASARCQAMGMLTMAIPTSSSPPDIVTVRSKVNESTLRDLLPRLTPAQREAAITLATRCGEPDEARMIDDGLVLRMEWGRTMVYVMRTGNVAGRTHVLLKTMDEIEAAVRCHIDIAADPKTKGR